MRLNKFLAKAGIASRRKCDELIEAGKVTINGKIQKSFSYDVTDNDIVFFNKNYVNLIFEPIVYLFNKPKGVISTVSDPEKRKTVLDYFPVTQRLFPVGRLDRDTTGVLLVTNDGDLAHRLMHPKFHIERIYIAETKIPIANKDLIRISNGINLENGQKVTGKITLKKKHFKKFIYEIILHEGKNREVKRIFTEFGSRVDSLHRKSFAGFELGNLKPGFSKIIPLKTIKSKLELW